MVRWLPLKRAELSDQLDRASLSIALDLLALEVAPPNCREAQTVLLRLMAVLTALVRR